VTEMTSSGADHLTKLDTTVAHSARLWNYLLGGKDNFAVDREAAEQVLAYMPELVQSARFNREFLGRAVRFLAGEAGIRQFLDIGTGLPTANNTHEVAQATAASSRIVYVDNDPMVLVHARALLTSSPEGATDYIDADLRDPERILGEAAQTLDFSQPVAVMLLGIVNFVVDDDQAHAIVRRLLDAVPPGSYLVISHPTMEVNPEAVERAMQMWNSSGAAPICARNPQEIASFFDGLELLEPGLVTVSQWRPDGNDTHLRAQTSGMVEATGQASSAAPTLAATHAGAPARRRIAAKPPWMTKSATSSGSTSRVKPGPRPVIVNASRARVATASTRACPRTVRPPSSSAARNTPAAPTPATASSHHRCGIGALSVKPRWLGTATIAAAYPVSTTPPTRERAAGGPGAGRPRRHHQASPPAAKPANTAVE
jgi:hypothetical protein